MLILPPSRERLREENLLSNTGSLMNTMQEDNPNDEVVDVDLDEEVEDGEESEKEVETDSEIDPEVEREIKKVIIEEETPKKAYTLSELLIQKELHPDDLFDDGSI